MHSEAPILPCWWKKPWITRKPAICGLFNFVRYIEHLQKYEVDYGEVNLSGAGEGSVEIMTIHKSKGLEFPVVILAGMGKQFNFQDLNANF